MLKQYQVTLMCKDGKYKPVSCIVTMEETSTKKEIQTKGIIKIAQKRMWNNADLKKYGYTVCKVREYDKERIEQENKERYEQIKQAKYQTGEWKRPTKEKE